MRALGRSARGVKAMNLDGGKLVDMCIVQPDKEVLTITANGFGKRCDIEEYRLQSRGGMGVRAGEFNDKTGDIIGLRQINPNDDVLLITNNGTTIRIKSNDVRKVGRNSMGVRMMKLRSGNSIASFATVEADANEPEEENTDGLPTASEFAENFEKQEQELAQNENAQDSEIATEPQSEVENENLENDENTQE